jgi:hypothetical protein
MVKLASNPGHALTFTPGNQATGKPEKPILPSKEEVAILRRTSLGFIKVTMIDGKPTYSYEDGSPISFRNQHNGRGVDRQFHRMAANGWLIPDKGDSLFGEAPQVYRARQLQMVGPNDPDYEANQRGSYIESPNH